MCGKQFGTDCCGNYFVLALVEAAEVVPTDNARAVGRIERKVKTRSERYHYCKAATREGIDQVAIGTVSMMAQQHLHLLYLKLHQVTGEIDLRRVVIFFTK